MALPFAIPKTAEQALDILISRHRQTLEKRAKDSGILDSIKEYAQKHLPTDFFEKDVANPGQTNYSTAGRMAIGGGLGALGGGLLGGVTGSKKKRTLNEALEGAVLGGVGGAGIGAIPSLGKAFGDSPNQNSQSDEAAKRLLDKLQSRNEESWPLRAWKDLWRPGHEGIKGTSGAYYDITPTGAAVGGVSAGLLHQFGKLFQQRRTNPTLLRFAAGDPNLGQLLPTIASDPVQLQNARDWLNATSNASWTQRAKRMGLLGRLGKGQVPLPGSILNPSDIAHAVDAQVDRAKFPKGFMGGRFPKWPGLGLSAYGLNVIANMAGNSYFGRETPADEIRALTEARKLHPALQAPEGGGTYQPQQPNEWMQRMTLRGRQVPLGGNP